MSRPVAEVAECVRKAKSLIKGRRLYMKLRRWRDADWYAAWNEIADEWESAAAEVAR